MRFDIDTTEHDKKVKADAINNFQEWLKSKVVTIDNNTNEILVIYGDKWELATEIYKEVNNG